MAGVHAFLSAKDLPNKSFRFGGVSADEEVFASEKVNNIFILLVIQNLRNLINTVFKF